MSDKLRERLERISSGVWPTAKEETRMAGALLRVLELHPRDTEPESVDPYCRPCLMTWPCPTVQAIEKAMEGK